MHEGFILYVIDVETTGLELENDIIEISAARVILEEKPVVEQKTWLLKALNPSTIQDDALRVNGHKREDITHKTEYGRENYKEPADVIVEFETWVADDLMSSLDRIWVGQNCLFDVERMQLLWKNLGAADTFPFSLENHNRILDTKQIVALFDVATGKRRQYWSLSNLVKACGTKKEKAHAADADVRMTLNLLLFLVDIIKDSVKEKFSNCYNE